MLSMYSCFSASGFVSSKRRYVSPPCFLATPKSKCMAFAWPMCKYPFGSGGNRVRHLPPVAVKCSRSLASEFTAKLGRSPRLALSFATRWPSDPG